MQSTLALLRTALDNPSSTQEATAQFIELARDADLNTCKQIVALLKATIKSNSSDVKAKLVVLEVLHSCAETGNLHFFSALGTKFIKRLAIMAAHRIDCEDVERGRDLFGKLSLVSQKSERASIIFLQKLLRYFVCWAKSVEGTTNRGALRIKRYYDELVRRGLKFPQQEPELSDELMKDMAICYRAISKLYSIIEGGGRGAKNIEKYLAKVLAFKAQIESEIFHLTRIGTSSAHLELLIRTNDDLDEAIQRCTNYTNTQVASAPVQSGASFDLLDFIDSSVKQHSPMALQANYLDDLMDLSIYDFVEPPDSLRQTEPSSKGIPMPTPSSPRAVKMDEEQDDQMQEQLYMEKCLSRTFYKLFETGRGALEEAYAQLVTSTQYAQYEDTERVNAAQANTIDKLEQELANANNTVGMLQGEQEQLKGFVRAQDPLKQEIEQLRAELAERDVKMKDYEEKIKALNQTVTDLDKKILALPTNELPKSQGDSNSHIQGSRTERSLSETARAFDFSTADLKEFITAPPMRFSIDTSYSFGAMSPFSQGSPSF